MRQPAPQAMRQPAPQAMRQPAPQAMRQPAPQAMRQPAPQAMRQPAPQAMRQLENAAHFLAGRLAPYTKKERSTPCGEQAPLGCRLSFFVHGL